MSIRPILNRLTVNKKAATRFNLKKQNRRRRALFFVPRFQQLEDRRVLATFAVDSTLDTQDANPGDGVAKDIFDRTSLRAAIMEANALGGADEITLPAGNYQLTIAGRMEDNSETGDLDILEDLTITGAGTTSRRSTRPELTVSFTP